LRDLFNSRMSTTLYLLRQQPDHISPSLLQVNDADIDIVFIEQSASIAPMLIKGAVVSGEGIAASGSRQSLTYDGVIEKIFSSEHVIVI